MKQTKDILVIKLMIAAVYFTGGFMLLQAGVPMLTVNTLAAVAMCVGGLLAVLVAVQAVKV